jgi:hypothetical protein
MGGADWPPLHFHECLVGWPCRCCPASDLGLLAERLAKASTAQPFAATTNKDASGWNGFAA